MTFTARAPATERNASYEHATSGTPLIRRALGRARWDWFWFDPIRPTSLGLIRIATGLIVLYVHLLYSFQLYEYFAPNGWVNLDVLNLMPRKSPVPPVVVPFGTPLPDPKTEILTLHTVTGDLELLPLEKLPEGERTTILRYQAEWNGADPRLNVAKGTPIFSVWFHVTDPIGMALVHAVVLLVMLLFTVGFATRITSVLTLLAALCYIHRSQTTLFGMDTMMNVLLIYLMIGPSGAALSVDRLLQRWWTVRKARQQGLPIPPREPPPPLMSARFALRSIQIHFCVIYMAAGLSKLLGSTWWSGTALWLCWANYEFAPFQFGLYQPFLIWLTQHRYLWELAASGSVIFTLIMELGLPILIWLPKFRWLMIIGAVMLHTGIAMSMGLTTFGLLMLCMLFAFVPLDTVERLLAKIPRPAFAA